MHGIFCLFLFFITTACISATDLNGKPHIIFILADDLGWNDVGFHGMTEIKTPNIDDLASDSVVLNNYYVAPQCTPSRAALLTGLYPSHTGLQNYVIPNTGPWGLPLDIEILPETLNKLGYTSRIVGKWHLGFYRSAFTPTRRGFKSHYGFWTGACDYYVKSSNSAWNRDAYVNLPDSLNNQTLIELTGLDFREDLHPLKDVDAYLTYDLTNRAVRIIQDHNKSEPLFLFLSHHAVHFGGGGPRAPPDYEKEFAYIENEERRKFAGVLKALDDSIGQVVQALSQANMLDNSIIVFSSDNGADSVSQTRSGGSNWPLRGQKFIHFEGGVRAVGFVWSKYFPQKGRVWDGLMYIADWYPTLYEAAGGNPEDLHHMDGQSMWGSIFTNQPSPRHDLLIFLDQEWTLSAIRVGDYKLMHGGYQYQRLDSWYGTPGRNASAFGSQHPSAVSSVLNHLYGQSEQVSHRKPIKVEVDCGARQKPHSVDVEPLYLFDLKNDPCEIENLASRKPKIVECLLARLKEYEKSAVPVLNKPRDYLSNPEMHDGIWSPWMDAS